MYKKLVNRGIKKLSILLTNLKHLRLFHSNLGRAIGEMVLFLLLQA